LRIGAEDFSPDALAAFFLCAAGAGIHAKQSSLLVVMLFCGGNAGEEQADDGEFDRFHKSILPS